MGQHSQIATAQNVAAADDEKRKKKTENLTGKFSNGFSLLSEGNTKIVTEDKRKSCCAQYTYNIKQRQQKIRRNKEKKHLIILTLMSSRTHRLTIEQYNIKLTGISYKKEPHTCIRVYQLSIHNFVTVKRSFVQYCMCASDIFSFNSRIHFLF